MCHGCVLLPIIAIYVPKLTNLLIFNMTESNGGLNMEILTLIVSILQLIIDLAACLGSSPTVRFYQTNIAQLVEHMAEFLFHMKYLNRTDKFLLNELENKLFNAQEDLFYFLNNFLYFLLYL